MKIILKLTIAILSLIFIASCSDSSSPAGDPNVQIVGEIATQHVNTELSGKIDRILNNDIDSIKIIRIRILMSRMMLLPANSNSTSAKVIKIQPFVYDLSLSGGLAVLGSSDVPSGLYEDLKIEIHRFSSSELDQYENVPDFFEFATPDRYTILIEGISYKDENPSIFVFKSDAVANLSLELEPVLDLKDGSTTTIAVQLDPNYFFKKWEAILDPTDENNSQDIENALINIIRAYKK
jgi:hypothetical protein